MTKDLTTSRMIKLLLNNWRYFTSEHVKRGEDKWNKKIKKCWKVITRRGREQRERCYCLVQVIGLSPKLAGDCCCLDWTGADARERRRNSRFDQNSFLFIHFFFSFVRYSNVPNGIWTRFLLPSWYLVWWQRVVRTVLRSAPSTPPTSRRNQRVGCRDTILDGLQELHNIIL